MTAEPGLESNNDSGIVPNCSQGLTTTDESAENSDHENQISDKPSKAFEQVEEEQPNEEESLKLFLEPDTEPMDADVIPSSQKEDIERSVSETSTPVLAKKLQNLGKNFDMEQLKETLSKKVSINFFLLFVFFDIPMQLPTHVSFSDMITNSRGVINGKKFSYTLTLFQSWGRGRLCPTIDVASPKICRDYAPE